jgi:hypothetical protein
VDETFVGPADSLETASSLSRTTTPSGGSASSVLNCGMIAIRDAGSSALRLTRACPKGNGSAWPFQVGCPTWSSAFGSAGSQTSFKRQPTDSRFVGSEATRSKTGQDGNGRPPTAATGTEKAALPAALLVGPRGLEPRTCGLRIWCEGAGQNVVSPPSRAYASQGYPSFPVVSFTGMRRGRQRGRRCHFAENATGSRTDRISIRSDPA